MKKVKNLTENKVLINTFKRVKTRNYVSKSTLKKRSFFFLKYKAVKAKNINCNISIKNFFNSLFAEHYVTPSSKDSLYFKHHKFLKSTVMFIKLDF